MATTTTKPFAPKPPNMTPIDPVTPEDDRPAICDLLSEHAEPVLKIKEAIESNPLYNPKLHDDLWMLRFWLSHKDSSSKTSKALKHAIDAAVETLEYRNKHKLDEADIRYSHWPDWDGPGGQFSPEEWRDFFSYADKYGLYNCLLHPDRGVITFVKYAAVHPTERVANLPMEKELEMYVGWTEWRFQVNDEVTRRTGRLTKGVMFIDLGGIGMEHTSLKAAKRDTVGNSMTANVYPQLNGGTFLLNMPSIFQGVIRLLRPFYPKRFFEKVDVLITKKDVNRIFPRFADLSTVPECYRGTLPSWPPPHNGRKYQADHGSSLIAG